VRKTVQWNELEAVLKKIVPDRSIISPEQQKQHFPNSQTYRLRVPDQDFFYEFSVGELPPAFTLFGRGIELVHRLILKATTVQHGYQLHL
jgi:hypothetical protein